MSDLRAAPTPKERFEENDFHQCDCEWSFAYRNAKPPQSERLLTVDRPFSFIHPQITPITPIHFRAFGCVSLSKTNLRNRRNLRMIILSGGGVVGEIQT